MKYDIKFSCGHIETVELFGKNADRERRIRYYENYRICSQCYRGQKNKGNSVNCIEKEMRYSEYKEQYGDCNIKEGSYDRKSKTIIVYVPLNSDDTE